jgi:hypothetical protein
MPTYLFVTKPNPELERRWRDALQKGIELMAQPIPPRATICGTQAVAHE